MLEQVKAEIANKKDSDQKAQLKILCDKLCDLLDPKDDSETIASLEDLLRKVTRDVETLLARCQSELNGTPPPSLTLSPIFGQSVGSHLY